MKVGQFVCVLTNEAHIVRAVIRYLAGGGTPEKTEELIQQCYQHTNKNGGEAAFDLARTKNALRDLRRKKR
jgi:hypothetical protein